MVVDTLADSEGINIHVSTLFALNALRGMTPRASCSVRVLVWVFPLGNGQVIILVYTRYIIPLPRSKRANVPAIHAMSLPAELFHTCHNRGVIFSSLIALHPVDGQLT